MRSYADLVAASLEPSAALRDDARSRLIRLYRELGATAVAEALQLGSPALAEAISATSEGNPAPQAQSRQDSATKVLAA